MSKPFWQEESYIAKESARKQVTEYLDATGVPRIDTLRADWLKRETENVTFEEYVEFM